MKKWLLICLLLETLCVTYFLKIPVVISFASVMYVTCGLVISWLLLRVRKPFDWWRFSFALSTPALYQAVLIVSGGIAIWFFTRQWIAGTPLSYVDADMLPIMQVMGKRFLTGEWSKVYDTIPEIWNGIQPIYLPAMWMPFLLSVKAGFDPRWITSSAVFLSFVMFIVLWRSHFQKLSGPILLLVAGILGWWLYTEHSHNFIRLSEEGVVVFYYCLFVMALLSGNFFWIGFTAAVCALSRYVNAGWFPAMMIYLLWIRREKVAVARFLVGGAVVVVLLVIIPFGLTPVRIALYQPQEYMLHAARVWKDNPEYFSQSVGLARFFGPDRILLQHMLLLIFSFLLPTGFVIACLIAIRWHKKMLYNIPLACLKLAVVTVYALIDVPYQYLYFTSSFISLLAITALTGDERTA